MGESNLANLSFDNYNPRILLDQIKYMVIFRICLLYPLIASSNLENGDVGDRAMSQPRTWPVDQYVTAVSRHHLYRFQS